MDVNVLLALAWPNHQFHRAATARLGPEIWATCALTELAFLRLSMNPAAVGGNKAAEESLALLAEMRDDPLHEYWTDLPTVENARREGAFLRVYGYRQVNDAYLLALARQHGARLLTFDRRLEALGADGVAEVLAP